MRTRSIVIIIVAGVTVVLAAVCISGWLLYSIATGRILGHEPPPTPALLEEARVVVGQSFLSRSVFVEAGLFLSPQSMGNISDVKVGEFDAHPGLDVVVVGSWGAIISDRNGVKQGQTIFYYPPVPRKVGPFTTNDPTSLMGDVEVVDLEGDGVCEYIARGFIDGAALFNHQGTMLWTYGTYTEQKGSINDLTIGDLDGDGVAELVVSWGGIEVFDKSGKPRSQVAEEYGAAQIEVVDTDGDGKNEIVSVVTSIKIRDATGPDR